MDLINLQNQFGYIIPRYEDNYRNKKEQNEDEEDEAENEKIAEKKIVAI